MPLFVVPSSICSHLSLFIPTLSSPLSLPTFALFLHFLQPSFCPNLQPYLPFFAATFWALVSAIFITFCSPLSPLFSAFFDLLSSSFHPFFTSLSLAFYSSFSSSGFGKGWVVFVTKFVDLVSIYDLWTNTITSLCSKLLVSGRWRRAQKLKASNEASKSKKTETSPSSFFSFSPSTHSRRRWA